jgi:hypothetical protein
MSFLISIITVMGISLYSINGGPTEIIMENGVEIQQALPGAGTRQAMDIGAQIFTITYIFLLSNIPTVVLLAIYAACRGKRNMQKALDKMSIQDLR